MIFDLKNSRMASACLRVGLLLLFAIIMGLGLPATARAQSYNWYIGYVGQGASCAYENDVVGVECATPADSCQSIAGADGTDSSKWYVTPGIKPGTAGCAFWYISYWNGVGLYTTCPAGQVADSNASGCAPVAASPKTLGKQCCVAGAATTGEPIDIGSGNMFYDYTDYSTAGQNKLSFSRSYNSRTSAYLALGGGWSSNYDRYIWPQSSTQALIQRQDGRMLTFNLVNGAWVSDTDVDYKLTNAGANWTLTGPDDTVEAYATSPDGTKVLLTTITTRDGYRQALAYNTLNQLTTVTDTYSRTLSFSYSGSQLQSVTTPEGTSIAYGYTAAGAVQNLTSVTYPTVPASVITYVYGSTNQPSALIGVIDENGNRYTSWTYDAYGRALSSTLGVSGLNAQLTTVAYNDTNGSRTVTNALGEQDVYSFATLQGVPKVTGISRMATATTAAATRTFTYDANGYLASQTDWNGVATTYVNNVHGLPTSITEAAGTGVARVTAIAWAANFHVPTSVATPGLTTSFTYDNAGDPLTRTDSDTTDGVTRRWTYAWSNSLLASVKGPRGDTTAFIHDSLGRLTAVTNALGQATRITANTAGGLPTTIVDPNGVTTNLAYDPRQRVLSSTVVTGAGNRTTSFAYDAAGNLIRTTLPDGSFLADSYDTAHRLVGIADALGEPIAYALDGLGDPTQTLISTAGGGAVWQNLAAFDALGRLIQDQRGAGQTTAFAYDGNGNVLAMVDPLSRVTKYAVDPLNRVTQIADPAGGLTQIAYDAHDRVTGVGAPNGAATSYTYDGLGRVTRRISPDTGTAFFYYDLADNLTQMTDGAGVVTKHTYDLLNRPTSTTYPGNTKENVRYTYDQSGHGFGIGRLTSVADAVGTLSLTYDERGNELGETRKSGSVMLTTGYGYDAASRVAAIGYPSGDAATYGRNAAGRVTAITAQLAGSGTSVPIAAGISYAPFGPVTGLTYGNGIVETRALDGDYRLTKLTTGAVQALGYGYNAADDVTSIANGVTPANNQAFGYDALDHLTAATGVYGSLAWTYDLVGNRLSASAGGASAETYGYLANSNRLTGILAGGETESFSYTGAGNIAVIAPPSGPQSSLTYNEGERLSGVAVGGTAVASYSYDAFGRRFMKKLKTSTAAFQYDQAGRLLEQLDGAGHANTDTVYLNGVPVASIAPATGVVSFLHTDRLGTPQLATSATKSLVWGATYEPFGNLDGQPAGSLTQNLRFPGQYADAETGWYQNGFRDYAPLWGRYLESDPIGLEGGLNTYVYATANPMGNVDPWGEDSTNWYNNTGGRSPWINGPTNGNWGGKCWSGGQYSCNGHPMGTASPTDSGDQCYMHHDYCYDSCGATPQKSCIAACDKQLVNELKQLPNDPKKWPQPPAPGTEGDTNRYRNAAEQLFR